MGSYMLLFQVSWLLDETTVIKTCGTSVRLDCRCREAALRSRRTVLTRIVLSHPALGTRLRLLSGKQLYAFHLFALDLALGQFMATIWSTACMPPFG